MTKRANKQAWLTAGALVLSSLPAVSLATPPPAKAAKASSPRAQAAAQDQKGLALYHARQFPQAVAAFHNACHLDGTNGVYQSHLALTLVGMQRDAQMVTEFRQIVALAPNQPSARYWLGRGLHETGHNADAETQLRVAVRLVPDQWIYHYYLAAALRADGKASDAASEQKIADRLRQSEPQETP